MEVGDKVWVKMYNCLGEIEKIHSGFLHAYDIGYLSGEFNTGGGTHTKEDLVYVGFKKG